MAWPRSNNSRSSAQTGKQPHNGVQATVTPAPDADSHPGSGQNTGVAGTTHAVADNQGKDARFPRHDRTASRRVGPIRYAHSGVDDAPGRAPDADDDATGGLVYEAPRPKPEPQTVPTDPYADSQLRPSPAEPPDEGISIFGNIATTEVTEEDEPTLDLRSFGRSPGAEPDRRPRAGRTRAAVRHRRGTSRSRPPRSRSGRRRRESRVRSECGLAIFELPHPPATASRESAFAIFPRMCNCGSGGCARPS